HDGSASVEIRYAAHHILQLHFGELGEDGQCERLARRALGLWEVPLAMLQVFEAFLQVQRHGVVDLGADAAGHEVLAQQIAVAYADDVLIEDVPHTLHHPRRLDGLAQSRVVESLVVDDGIALAPAAPRIEMLQLDVEHRGLDFIDAEIAADVRVVVLRLAAVYAQNLYALRQLRIVSDAQPRIAEGAEILRGEEGEAPDIAEAAGAPSVRILRTDRLRRILDDLEPEAPRDLHERSDVGHLPVEVHRHDRLDGAARLAMDELA